ncbi:hypothetical protein RJ639_019069 [Escallonia herrerae]|uniref:Ubiquitin-like domain-containing protein n=1 Tax=Escallonia herrerae TaxID=1293975 RepID=A0AA89AK67_9ASTE|nr:hypothetical protein RJ639_019069 [Escallonia herrerae]
MASCLQIQGDESVLLRVTHSNIKSFSPEVRFSIQMTVEAVKEKLWKKCGTSVNSMCVELYDDTGARIANLSDNTRPFGFYSPQDGDFERAWTFRGSLWLGCGSILPVVGQSFIPRSDLSYRLHVIDLDPSSVTSGGWLEDTSLVEKYTLSEEAYDKLDGKSWQNIRQYFHIVAYAVIVKHKTSEKNID